MLILTLILTLIYILSIKTICKRNELMRAFIFTLKKLTFPTRWDFWVRFASDRSGCSRGFVAASPLVPSCCWELSSARLSPPAPVLQSLHLCNRCAIKSTPAGRHDLFAVCLRSTDNMFLLLYSCDARWYGHHRLLGLLTLNTNASHDCLLAQITGYKMIR